MVRPIRQFYLGLALRGSCQIGLNRVCKPQVNERSSRAFSAFTRPFCIYAMTDRITGSFSDSAFCWVVSQFEFVSAQISSKDQTWSDTSAAIAGVTLSDL